VHTRPSSGRRKFLGGDRPQRGKNPRDAGDGASHGDIEENVGCGSHPTKRLRSDAQLLCVCFIPMFAVPRLKDAQLVRKDQQTAG